MTSSHHVSLGSSRLRLFLRLSFFFYDLDNFEGYLSGILKNIPQWGFVTFFRMIQLSFREEVHRGNVPFSSHHFKGTSYQPALPLWKLTLIICNCKVTLPPPFL